MSLESYFAGLLTSCSNSIICLRMPLSFVVFPICEGVFCQLSLEQKRPSPVTAGFPLLWCLGMEFAVPRNREQRVERMLKALMRMIWPKSRERWGRWTRKKSSLSLLVKELGRTFKRLSGSRVWTNKSLPAVRLCKGLSQDVVNATHSFTWIQWQFSGCYSDHRYRKRDLQLSEY